MKWYEKKLTDKDVVAIGEIGLDYYYENSDRKTQLLMLDQFLQLATRSNTPVILHIRPKNPADPLPVFDDLFELFDKYGASKLKGVFHCFAGNKRCLYRCLDYGFFISIAGNITFSNAQQLQQVSKEIPLDRLLLETDSPYLSPHPLRGEKNTPLNIDLVYQKLAQLRGVTPQLLSDVGLNNWVKLFS